MKLDLIEIFLSELEKENIAYVHWKSNTNIDKALSGEDDLDILVDPNKKHEIYTILKKFNIIRGYSEKDSWQNEIFHYFGMDIDKKELVHIHLHFLLEVGYDFDKSVNLPIVQKYIEDRIKYKSIYIPEVEKEYILLIIRLLLKNAFIPFLLMLPTAQFRYYKRQKSNGVVTGSAYREFEDLHSRIDRDKLQRILRDTFPFIGNDSFSNYEKTVEKNNSLKDYFLQAGRLKKELKEYSYFSGVKSFLLSFYRINSGRVKTIFKNKSYFKKTPQNGGRIFAFVGGDGAGKSTNIEKLRNILKSHFYTEVIHIGRPKRHFRLILLRIIGKSARILKINNFGEAVGLLALAYDRKKSFETALKIRQKGGIVLLDRIPIEGITSMDGPKIHTINNNQFKWMSWIEMKWHSIIKDVDELIVLTLDPKIAFKRRPEDGLDVLTFRHGEIANKNFSDIGHAHLIDSSNSFEYVEKSILKVVWQSLNCKPLIYEILGLAGSGKSTMKNMLDNRYQDFQFDIDGGDKAKGLLLISKIPVASYILYKTGDIIFPRAYLFLQNMLNTLSSYRITNYEKLLFDQGPIYIIARLIKEVPSLESHLLNELKKILIYFDETIYLEASPHILFSRIKTREQEHEIKNSDARTQEEFIEKFMKIYKKILDVCYEGGVKVTIINTEDNDIEMVGEMIIKILDKEKIS